MYIIYFMKYYFMKFIIFIYNENKHSLYVTVPITYVISLLSILS